MRYWAWSIQPKVPEISVQYSVQLENFQKNGPPFRWTTFPSRTSLKFVKWIAPIEIAIYFAVARVGEFVRDNASLGEFRRDKEIWT